MIKLLNLIYFKSFKIALRENSLAKSPYLVKKLLKTFLLKNNKIQNFITRYINIVFRIGINIIENSLFLAYFIAIIFYLFINSIFLILTKGFVTTKSLI